MKHSCAACGYSGRDKHALAKHMLTKKHVDNLENSLACMYCDKIFKRSFNLRRHTLAIHGIDLKAKKVLQTRYLLFCRHVDKSIEKYMNIGREQVCVKTMFIYHRNDEKYIY